MKEGTIRGKKLLLLILVILAVTGIIAWYLLSDHQPPEVENLDYKKIVKKGEQQQVIVTVKEKNPANSLKLELNGSSLDVPLVKNFGNGTIIYSTSFDPSKISSREGYLVGTLFLKDASGNEARSQIKFLANLKEPEIIDLRIDRVALGNYKISAQIADDSSFSAFLQFLNGTKIPLTKTDGRYAANVSTLTDLDFMLKAVDAYNMSSSIQGTIKISGRDKFEIWLYSYSSLFRELFEKKRFDEINKILTVAQLNGSAVPKNLAYQVLDQIERDKRVLNKFETASMSFDLLSSLGISNLNNKASIYIPGNYSLAIFQGLPKHQNADLTRLFSASESCPDIVDFEPITIKDAIGQVIVIQSSNVARDHWMIAEFLSKRPEIASQAQKFEWINRMIQQIAWDIFDNEYGPGFFDGKSYSPTDKEVWQVILSFHDYMDSLPSKLIKDGIGIVFPYNNATALKEYIPDKTNRTIALFYLADLPSKTVNKTVAKEITELYESGKITREEYWKLMGEKAVVAGMKAMQLFVEQLPSEYEEILNAYKMYKDSNDYGTPLDAWRMWLYDRANNGLSHAVEQFSGIKWPSGEVNPHNIDNFLSNVYPHWKLIKIIYGYERLKPDWGGEAEMYTYGLPIAYKAFGIPLGYIGGQPYIFGTMGGEWAVPLPDSIITNLKQAFPNDRIAIGFGNIIGLYSCVDGLEKDSIQQIFQGLRYEKIYLWKK